MLLLMLVFMPYSCSASLLLGPCSLLLTFCSLLFAPCFAEIKKIRRL